MIKRDDWQRYELSAFLTFIIFVLFFTLLFIAQLIPIKQSYGASQLTVELSIKDLPALEKAKESRQEGTHSSSLSRQKQVQQAQKIEDDYVEPEFEEFLSASGKKEPIAEKKLDKKLATGVHYGEKKGLKTQSSGEGVNPNGEEQKELLSQKQLEKLNQSGSVDEKQLTLKREGEGREEGKHADGMPSPWDAVIDISEYQQNRKKLLGEYPDLAGVDLAGRLFITAVVGLVVKPSGTVSLVRIIQSSGSSEIDSALMRSLRYWKFERVGGSQLDNPLLRLEWRPEGAH